MALRLTPVPGATSVWSTKVDHTQEHDDRTIAFSIVAEIVKFASGSDQAANVPVPTVAIIKQAQRPVLCPQRTPLLVQRTGECCPVPVLPDIPLMIHGRSNRALPGIAGITRVLRRRDMIRKIDDAILGYRRHPAALIRIKVLYFLIDGVLLGSAIFASRAVGTETELPLLVAALAVLFFSGSLPASFIGFGVMEPLGVALLAEPGTASAAQIVAMLVLFRCYILLVGLAGSLFALRGDLTLEPSESPERR